MLENLYRLLETHRFGTNLVKYLLVGLGFCRKRGGQGSPFDRVLDQLRENLFLYKCKEIVDMDCGLNWNLSQLEFLCRAGGAFPETWPRLESASQASTP